MQVKVLTARLMTMIRVSDGFQSAAAGHPASKGAPRRKRCSATPRATRCHHIETAVASAILTTTTTWSARALASVSAEGSDVAPEATISLAASMLANPMYLAAGGILALAGAAGAITHAQDRASGSLISRLVKEAERAEETWGQIIEEKAETERAIEESLETLNAEWRAAEEARRALEEAEARAKRVEEESAEMRTKAEELRVKSAAAWINNWRAKSKLEGTLKITAEKKSKKNKTSGEGERDGQA